LFAGLLTWASERQAPSRIWLLSTGLAIGGCALLLSGQNEAIQLEPLGVLAALTAGLAYVIYAAALKRLTQSHPSEEVVALCMMLGAVLLAPLLLISETGWLWDPRGVLIVLHLG
ncbi:MAG: EamA family transporter, partial [Chloroflexi bacterium]|nr:EamA family transporter [Chloroflexota bacterium]